MFDILILIAPKDYNKFRFVYDSIVRNIEGYHELFVISPTYNEEIASYKGVTFLTDSYVLDYDFSKIKMTNRIGWYKQQFIKLFQKVTIDDYLVIDADAYINFPIDIDIYHPLFFIGKYQNHEPYFTLMKDLFQIEKYDHVSYINEIMHFKRYMINCMVKKYAKSDYDFIDKCIDKINDMNDASGFSEYELYGNFVMQNFKYYYYYTNTLQTAKKRKWSDDEIKNYINKYKNSDYGIITMHSWI